MKNLIGQTVKSVYVNDSKTTVIFTSGCKLVTETENGSIKTQYFLDKHGDRIILL